MLKPDTGQDVTQLTKKTTLSGWIGSVLEFYDFFIYATAASLIFPKLFFPSSNPTVAIIASLATYSVGYVARPIGAVILGHMGDRYGRRRVLVFCLNLMGLATFCVGLLPTYDQIGIAAPLCLVILRLIQGFAVAGELSGSSSMILESAPFGRRGFFGSFSLQGAQVGHLLAASIFLSLAAYMPTEAFNLYGWRIPFLASIGVIFVGYLIRRDVAESPIFTKSESQGAIAAAPVLDAIKYHYGDMIRVGCIALMNVIPALATMFGAAYAVQPAYGIGFPISVFLWIPVMCNILAVMVIPLVGKISDKIGRRLPIAWGAVLSGLLAFAYLWAISIHSIPLAIIFCLVMWGVVYQGYNAVFPSFFPELFPARTRVSGMAIAQNIGVMMSAMLPALFAVIAPPGTAHIPLLVGGMVFAVTVIAALAALSARETYRIHIHDLGNHHAIPEPKSAA
ncbi:MAG: MFS transporter [Alphaproteobacteria bacterium]|nr:MFS transporter [Alphaproteobacteria bacterium]